MQRNRETTGRPVQCSVYSSVQIVALFGHIICRSCKLIALSGSSFQYIARRLRFLLQHASCPSMWSRSAAVSDFILIENIYEKVSSHAGKFDTYSVRPQNHISSVFIGVATSCCVNVGRVFHNTSLSEAVGPRSKREFQVSTACGAHDNISMSHIWTPSGGIFYVGESLCYTRVLQRGMSSAGSSYTIAPSQRVGRSASNCARIICAGSLGLLCGSMICIYILGFPVTRQ